MQATPDRFARDLPLLLSVIAGATDIIGFLGLNGLFTAHITGNLVVLAARIVAGSPAMVTYILSVPIFMLVLFVACLGAGIIERRGGSAWRPLLVVQFLALAAFFVLGITAGPWRDADAKLAIVAGMLGVAAMAVHNALVQTALKHVPTTAVMTTNIAHFMLDLSVVLVGSDAAQIVKARSRMLYTVPVIFGFALGCGLGAAAEAVVGLWALILPASLALFAVVLATEPAPTADQRGGASNHPAPG